MSRFDRPSGARPWRRAPRLRASLVLAIGALSLTVCRGTTEPLAKATWSQIAAGGSYTCGLDSAGTVYCWGGVDGYYLPPSPPDSAIPNSAVPMRVPGALQFAAITVGDLVMCGLDPAGRASCWGSNAFGEVGDLSTVAKRGPSLVVGGHRWRMIDAGGSHVCGVTVEGTAYCWGNNFRGALGLGNGLISGASGEPLRVATGVSFSAVWAGAGTSCALTTDGTAYCWGINDYGMLGDGQSPEPFPENPTPAPVVGGLSFTQLSIGAYNVCGLTLDARAFCWGYGGVLGNGSTQPSSSPVPVSGDHRWKSLSVGAGHSCGLTTDGAAYCWGNGERGRLGTGDTSIALMPRLVAEPGSYATIVAGAQHSCALSSDNVAFCWGRGDHGELGHGLMRDELRPVQVSAPQ